MSGTGKHWTERTVRPTRAGGWTTRVRRKRQGFSLSEFVVGIAVAGLLIASSITTLTMGFRIFTAARDRQTANQILRHEMDALRLQSWREIDEGGRTVQFQADLPLNERDRERFRVERRVSERRSGQYAVELRVFWTDAFGRDREETVWTLFTRNGLHAAYGNRS